MTHVIANRCDGFGLTAAGRDQVRALCDQMAGIRAAGIWSSPLLRALQTAEAVSAALGTSVAVSEALREFDCGELEGRTDASAWQQHMDILRTWLLAGSFDERLLGGESGLEVRDRLAALVKELSSNFGETDAELVLVGHAGLYAVALPFLMPQIPHAFAWEHPLRKAGRVVAACSRLGLRCLSWDGIDLSTLT